MARQMENTRMTPRRSTEKLVVFGTDESNNRFSAEMLRTSSIHEKWVELAEIPGLTTTRSDMSMEYCGDDRVAITGGVGECHASKVSAPYQGFLRRFSNLFLYFISLPTSQEFWSI